MTENQAELNEESSEKKLDLSTLNELSFGPSWADKTKRPDRKEHTSKGRPRSKEIQSNRNDKRDRRNLPDRSQPKSHDNRGSHSGGRPHHGRSRPQAEIFQPTVTVNIYPQDDAFEALVKRLRSTARTYQLFEIAHLILEKPERYVVVVQNKTNPEEEPKPLYYTVFGSLPFETEEAAINYVLGNCLDELFDIEEIEVEPPKGNFQMVNQCRVTGELLGPPNYHRYQEFLQRHYASKINNMAFESFVSKIGSVKDQESIDSWVESMKKGARYTLKERKEDEPESFESLEAVRLFLVQNRKDAIVGSGKSVRFAGRDIKHLPKGALRRSIEAYIEHQLRFPLDTANNIRGRLRRHKFTVYKKGAKGISHVCAVRRKFRDSKTAFTSSIQDLIEFIEKHPNIQASKLPKRYIGIDTEKQKPAKLEMAESESAEEQASVEDEASNTVNEEESEPTPVKEAVESPAPDTIASTDAMPKEELGEDELKQLNQLMLDLRWLITEGYVTEYGDGSLFASPPMPEAKPKDSIKPHAQETKADPTLTENVAEVSETVSQISETVTKSADEALIEAEALPESEEKSE